MKLEVGPNTGRHSTFEMALEAKCGCRFQVCVHDDGNDDGVFTPCEIHKEAVFQTDTTVSGRGSKALGT